MIPASIKSQGKSDFDNNDEKDDNFFQFCIKNQTLIVKNSKKKQILEFPDYNAVNKRKIIEEFKEKLQFNLKINEYLIINCVKPNFFQQYNFYKYKEKNWAFHCNLLKYILKSKTINTILTYLRPELKKFEIFSDDKILDEIIESIIFVPYEIGNAYGATSKTFLKIFINGLSPKFVQKGTIVICSSSFQIVNIH